MQKIGEPEQVKQGDWHLLQAPTIGLKYWPVLQDEVDPNTQRLPYSLVPLGQTTTQASSVRKLVRQVS